MRGLKESYLAPTASAPKPSWFIIVSMLETLSNLMARLVLPAASPDPEQDAHRLQLATAVMLVEVMRADTQFQPAERRAVLQGLRDKFQLGEDEAERLAELAESEARDATDWFGFTSHINEHFEMPAKLRMIELMWNVAYADGHLSAHEQHVLWRIADLLHVPHGAYISAKMRARDAAGAA